MIKQLSAACVVATAMMASPSFAQTAAPAPDGGSFMTQMSSNEWRGSKLVGVDVYGTDNAKIGDINEVIVDNSGSIKAVVIGVGGFLGIGEKNVAIPFGKVEWTRNDQSGSAMNTSATAPAAPATTSTGMAQTTTNSMNSTAPMRDTTSATGTAASSSAKQDYPDRAMVRMSKQDLQNAPEFHYASSTSSNSGVSTSGTSTTAPSPAR